MFDNPHNRDSPTNIHLLTAYGDSDENKCEHDQSHLPVVLRILVVFYDDLAFSRGRPSHNLQRHCIEPASYHRTHVPYNHDIHEARLAVRNYGFSAVSTSSLTYTTATRTRTCKRLPEPEQSKTLCAHQQGRA